ncbi:xylanase [Pseudohalioglobus sediminis]|uniref:Xylanase n=1 Tax=Pseudohalioglobus sediminis TaxID=2606449 RepID=A0A5B0WQF5_9GAMM|nr:glycoside hydrolase [Pseudohalioglobus sediminis]KAA1188411.1 xylanase [Pseudohalioglobus sediminis]
MTTSGRIFRCVGCLSLLFSVLASRAGEATLHINIQQTHQHIEAFGASDAWAIDPAVKQWLANGEGESVVALADLLFSIERGIGLSAWRFNIGAGSAEQGEASRIPDPYRRAELLVAAPGKPVDGRKQAGQVRMLKEARDRGVGTFVAFNNSPPHWATKNGLTHPAEGEGIGSTNLDPARVDDFSRFLVQVLQYLRGPEVGVPVNYVSPANEPTWHWQDQTQEGNRYNNDDLAALYRSLHRALEAAGLGHAVEIDGVEAPEYRVALADDLHKDLFGERYSGGMSKTPHGDFKNYFDVFLGDPEMQTVLGNKISLHGYFSENSAQRLGPLRDAMAKNLARISPAPSVWMSEYCVLGGPGDVRDFDGHGFDVNDYHYAEHVARIIHRDLTRLDVSAWFWWLALTPYDYKDGLIKIDADLAPESMQASKVFWVLGQYSRFIRPGYQRIGLPGFDDLHGLMASAYRSPAQDRLVVVVVNAGEEAATLSLGYHGLPNSQVAMRPQPYKTDAKTDLGFSPGLVDDAGKVTFPGHSVVSLVIDLDTEAR